MPTAQISADATVAADSTTTNHSTAWFLSLQAGAAARRAFLFGPPQLPAGATVVSATLRVRQYKVWASATRELTVQPVTAQWTESKITWANQPAVSAEEATETITGTGSDLAIIDFDVTDMLQAVAEGEPWYGFRIISDSTSLFRIYSSESPNPPQLIVEYTTAPSIPTRLSPSGGRAVSVARPWLTFDGPAQLSGYQLQMNATNDFTAPTYDTGVVDATLKMHHLTVDVAVDATPWWRVIVRDSNGRWSPDYSDPVQFTRKPKETITITNPPVAPDNIVTDPTPPFSWTTDNQTAYRVRIVNPTNEQIVFWDSLRQGGDDNSATPPDKKALKANGTYEVIVDAEDDIPREATPGDPVAAQARRTFTFELSTDVDPVTDLTVTQADERPWGTADFESAEMPDRFEVLRGIFGDPADPVSLGLFDGADLLVAGTSYRFVDRTVPPQGEYEWTVRRIENGVTSDDNPIAVATIKAIGAWLSSVDGEHIVKITTEGSDPVRWSADEIVEVFRPYGGTKAHPVTYAIFGREGTLDGFVKPWKGQTLAEARAAVAAMRPPVAPYGTPMVLTQVDEATTVFWTGVMADRKHEYVDKFKIEATLNEIP